jgi:hypothetical protein
VAIEDLFGADTKHFVSQGIYELVNNNRSERLQGSFRQRTKTMRGLQTRATGQHYLDGWVLDYNLFKDHHALGGKTPADVAGVDVPYREWADVTRRGTRKNPSDPNLALTKPEVSATRSARRRKLPSLASVAEKIRTETAGGSQTPSGARKSSGAAAGEYQAMPKPGAKQSGGGRGGHDFRMTGPRRKR